MDKASSNLPDTGSSSKVIVITPEQIKKLGLESDVKSAAVKTDKPAEPDNLILNIRSKLSTLLKPVEKLKPKVGETKEGVTYKKIPIRKEGMPMGKLTRISMNKEKTVTTYADKSNSRLPIDSRILNMRTMLSKKMVAEKLDESIADSNVKQPEAAKTSIEIEADKITGSSTNPCSNNKIQILSVVPLNVEGNLNESRDNPIEFSQDVKEESINLQNIDFIEDDKVHESKNAIPILHFRNASGAVIELFQETNTKSDEEESLVSQDTEGSEKREENGSTFEDVDDNSDSDVDRSKFKSYLKYSKFKRTKPVGGIKMSEETVESEQNEQTNIQSSTTFLSESNETKVTEANVESKFSDEEEAKDIIELKPVPINQRTVSNASSEINEIGVEKANDQSVIISGKNEEEEELEQANEDGLKPILKRKMSTTSVSEESTGTPAKRGRGRPKKLIGTSPQKIESLSPVSPVKKVVKKKVLLAEDGTPIVRKRGRPAKDPNDINKKSTKSPPKVEVTSVKTYSKKVPIASVPISQTPKSSAIGSKVPSMIKLEIDIGPEASVVVNEEPTLEQEQINSANTPEQCKPTSLKKSTPSTEITSPRKRGRPKKSDTPLSESPSTIAWQPKSKPSPKVGPREVVVSRSGRKRKKIDYSAMNEGESNSEDSYAEEDPPTKPDISDRDFEGFPIRSSFNKEYEHKVYPAKRKSFKSESDTNENENKEGEISVKQEASNKNMELTEESSPVEQKSIPCNSAMKADETPKKKRGRPKRIPHPTTPLENSSDAINAHEEAPDSTPLSNSTVGATVTSKKVVIPKSIKKTTTSKKPEHAAASEDDNPKMNEQSEHEGIKGQQNDEVKTPVQSRKKEMSVDAAFACMFNMISKETNGPHPINVYARTNLSAKSPPAEDRGTVVCALCETEVPMKSFSRHNLTKHNNLAWTVGNDVLDLSNYGIVLAIYTDLYKAREKFICDRKCGIVKKSVMGYLSHYIVCQKSPEEVDDMKKACEACGKLIMPFFYVNHLKDCKHELPDDTQKSKRKSYTRKIPNRPQTLPDDVKTLSIAEVLSHMLEMIKANKSGVNAINVYLRMDLEDLEKREPPPADHAICALCNMEMESSKFILHNLNSHNNLSWKIGEPKLELDKYEFVIPTLNTMYGQRNPFICEQCSTAVKSVWGFLWHVATCGKKPEEIDKCKLECPLCQTRLVPTNYMAHTKGCHGREIIGGDETLPEQESEAEHENVGKKKRAAATKASKFIQELTTTDAAKGLDNDVLNFIYIDHKFYKSKKLVDSVQKRVTNQKNINCLFNQCDYTNEDMELLICHLFTCLKKPKKNFTCKLCFAILKTTREAESHIHEQHKERLEPKDELMLSSSSSAEEEDNEGILETKTKKRIRRENREDVVLTPWELVRIQDLRLYKVEHIAQVQLTITKHLTSNFPIAYKWTREFVKQHFTTHLHSSESSFSDWKSVSASDIVPYLPKLRTSFDVTFFTTDELTRPIQKDHKWKSFKLFEAQRGNDSWTLFCGGPIHSMAWAPIYTSDEEEPKKYDQYLAVSVLSDPDIIMRQGQVKTESSLIQIWNFGPLHVEHSMFEAVEFKPHLEYCLAHKHGDYCCMEWCPSGGFDVNRRLGLLAIGGSDSFVHIYEMPLENSLNKQGSIIFEAIPKFKLECMKLNEMDYSEKHTIPTSISWTKAKDHRYIAVGYCSGLLAIFDIFTDSSHLKSSSRDNVIILKPYLVFAGHAGPVKALSLHHMNGGNRWLATFSLDKTHKLWDLENHSQPIYIFTKFHMVDGIWPTHWLSTIIAFDDIAIKGQGSTGAFFPIKRFTGSYFHFYNYSTRTNSLAVSDWSNMIAYCNVVGHIMGGFVNTCIPTTSHGMPAVRNYNISFTEVIDKTIPIDEAERLNVTNKSNEFNGILEEITYAPAKKRYGIIFRDSPITCYRKLEEMRKKSLKNSKVISLMDGKISPAMYPLRSATKVAINPNQQAHSYIAVGYQLGFVRIFCPYLYKDRK